MLSANELEAVSMALDKPMRALELRIMEDIIRRIKINGEITRAADWQINRLYELGIAKDDIAQIIAQSLDLDSDDLQKMYSDVIEAGYARDDELYKALGIQRIAFEDNEELHQLLSAVSEQTLGELKNITQSLGFAVKQPNGKITFTEIGDFYQQTLDSAMLDIASGAFDYNTVLMRTVKQLTNSGLRSVDYATGWSNRVDVAARRAVMTGMSQLTAKVNEDNMTALDTEYVEVSWHSGARPSHQEWQGKIYHWPRGKNVDKSGESGIIKKNKPLKISMQFFAKKSKDFSTIILPNDEYAHVMSEIATNISDLQKSKKVFIKAIGKYNYTVENNGFGNYRIIGKREVK